jgi:NADH:ubiquinone oxidoreductase subunit 6 (subunit J)
MNTMQSTIRLTVLFILSVLLTCASLTLFKREFLSVIVLLIYLGSIGVILVFCLSTSNTKLLRYKSLCNTILFYVILSSWLLTLEASRIVWLSICYYLLPLGCYYDLLLSFNDVYLLAYLLYYQVSFFILFTALYLLVLLITMLHLFFFKAILVKHLLLRMCLIHVSLIHAN